MIAACAVTSRNAIVVPLHADRALGALVVEHDARHGARVERRVVSMLERFCSHASLVLSNVTLLMQIRDQATTDMLTGLANRRALEEALGRACAHADREHEPLSLAMVDIDHFKAFNDTHGHQLGDRVLQLVGKTLGQQTRASDVAARYGGEEFCVLMPGIEIEAAAETARRLCAAITAASGELLGHRELGRRLARGRPHRRAARRGRRRRPVRSQARRTQPGRGRRCRSSRAGAGRPRLARGVR